CRPEEVWQLTALDRGTLVHDALEQFFREREEAGALGDPWTDADRHRLAAIVEACGRRAEAQGLTGKPVLWRQQLRDLLVDLADFLDVDQLHRSETGLVPERFEVAFGYPDAEIGRVLLAVGSRTLRFRGRID